MPTRTGGDGDVHHADYFADISDQGNNSKTPRSLARAGALTQTRQFTSMRRRVRWSQENAGHAHAKVGVDEYQLASGD